MTHETADEPGTTPRLAPGVLVVFDLHPTWHHDDLVIIGEVRQVGTHTVEVLATGGGRLALPGRRYYPWPEDVHLIDSPSSPALPS